MNQPDGGEDMNLKWKDELENDDWEALSALYKIAPLGEEKASDLETVFGNSRYKCFVYSGTQLVGVGRALADGLDCSILCDIAVHPDCQGTGLGKRIVQKLKSFSEDHKKNILYSNPGKEGFYKKLGFKSMNTAMAIFKDEAHALKIGLIHEV